MLFVLLINFHLSNHNNIYILKKIASVDTKQNLLNLKQFLIYIKISWILYNNPKKNFKNIWETTEIEYAVINLSLPKQKLDLIHIKEITKSVRTEKLGTQSMIKSIPKSTKGRACCTWRWVQWVAGHQRGYMCARGSSYL